MRISKPKISDNSSGLNLIVETKLGVQKQDTNELIPEEFKAVKISKEFYIIELCILALGLSNNIHLFLTSDTSTLILLVGGSSFCLMVLLSLLLYLLETTTRAFKKLSHPLIFFFGGLGMIISDPEILQLITHQQLISYCPSMLQLMLATVLQSSSNSAINLNFIGFFLGILTMCLSISEIDSLLRCMYLLIVHCIICIKLWHTSNKPRKIHSYAERYEEDDSISDLDFSEIIESLQGVIESLNNLKSSFKEVGFYKLIEILEQIFMSLKKNHNIYTAKLESVTKFMDEQDRVFIEQSCFASISNLLTTLREGSRAKENTNFTYGVSELMGVLSQVGKDWNFNTFFVCNISNKEPIQVLGSYCVHRYGLHDEFSIPESVISSFFSKLEKSYKNNPYHNACHGGDVLCSYMYLVANSDIHKHMSSLELLAGIIATVGHDAGHPGKTNRFLVLNRDDIAMAYNDISVLEMMHASIIFNICKDSDSNLLLNLDRQKWMIARKCIIDMILATDMAKHFDMMAQFRVKYHEMDFVDLDNHEIRYDIYRLVMKAADIGHAAKNIELHEKWCRLVVEEFYEQGDLEKELGLPISMYCDRATTDISKSQAGFIKNIVYPLFTTLNSIILSEMIEINCLGQIRNNELYWVMRRKTIRGQSAITKREEYASQFHSIPERRADSRKQSLPSTGFK